MILDTLGNSTPKDNTEEGLEVESDASNTTPAKDRLHLMH